MLESRDLDAVRRVLTDPDVWQRIGGQGPPDDFEVPPECTYLLGLVRGEVAGVFVLHEKRDGTDSHVQILPEYRKYKKELGESFLRKASRYVKYVTTDIPKSHPNVHFYALKNGYRVIGEDAENWYYRKDLDGVH